MARIKTYGIDTIISDKDIIIGSDFDNSDQTKNFQVADLRQYVLSGLEPEVGGNLKITTLSDESLVYLTPESWINSQDPAITVLHYEIVFLILNGRTYIFRKNNGVYGVGNLQAVSDDFTEIDITSVITSSLQDLSSVLEIGNSAPYNSIESKSISLWNSQSGNYGVTLDGRRNKVNFYKYDGSDIGSITTGQIYVQSGGSGFFIDFPDNPTVSSRTATFQDASGTVAYVDDIPEVPVLDVVAGTNVTITDVDGIFTVNSIQNYPPDVQNIQLRDSITDTTYVNSQDCNFEYNETTSPINSVRFVFYNNIEFTPYKTIKGRAYFKYENGKVAYRNLVNTVATLSGNYVEFDFPLETYWNLYGATEGNKLKEISFSFAPNVIKDASNNVMFNGVISEFNSKFLNASGTYE